MTHDKGGKRKIVYKDVKFSDVHLTQIQKNSTDRDMQPDKEGGGVVVVWLVLSLRKIVTNLKGIRQISSELYLTQSHVRW